MCGTDLRSVSAWKEDVAAFVRQTRTHARTKAITEIEIILLYRTRFGYLMRERDILARFYIREYNIIKIIILLFLYIFNLPETSNLHSCVHIGGVSARVCARNIYSAYYITRKLFVWDVYRYLIHNVYAFTFSIV